MGCGLGVRVGMRIRAWVGVRVEAGVAVEAVVRVGDSSKRRSCRSFWSTLSAWPCPESMRSVACTQWRATSVAMRVPG